MYAEFKNGATVSMFYTSLKCGELIAAFQYDRDAVLFAEMKARECAERKSDNTYVVTDHHSGKVTIVRAVDVTPRANVEPAS